MSGIVAIVNVDGAPTDARLLRRMTEFLACRGPDRQRVHIVRNAGLGHALLDVDGRASRDEQPFSLDGRTWVVADARIDAREDLAARLAGREPDTCRPAASDVELIARAYRAWGEECPAYLIGDFAFAVWDQTRGTLFCARDQLGVKPIFFARFGRTVIVSNALDCVRLHPSASDDLHEPAIADFLLFGAIQESDSTVFRDVRRLPAAHCITWSSGSARQRRYWTLPVEEPVHFTRAADYTERFGELLRAAVRDRLRTRRAGVFMSGGIDSTTLAAAAVGVLRERPDDFFLQAFTCVYDRLIPDSERRYAALAAAHLQIPIRFDARDDETSIPDWDRVSIRTPEPIDNPAAFAAAVGFARSVSASARVLLYGEGPDNALLYEWRPYLAHLVSTRQIAALVRAVSSDLVMHRRVPVCSSVLQRARAWGRTRQWLDEFPAWLDEGFAARHQCRERWAARRVPAPSPHPVRPRAYAAFDLDAVGWQPLFDYCDVTSAASHTEIRHPFLDLRVLRYMLALPPMPWCRNKLIIRRSMRTSLPRAVLRRRKTPVVVSPDLARVRASGLPRLAPTPALRSYVDPSRIPLAPNTEIELRAALRPLGLNYWLRQLEQTAGRRHEEETSHETARAVQL
jgi:asparagine synthase (glutamine-hydrolysing)